MTAGDFPRYLGLELRLALRGLLSGSEPFGCSALFGNLQSGVGVGQPFFEHLSIRDGFGQFCFTQRKTLSRCGGVYRSLLLGPFEGGFDLAQLSVCHVPSRSGLRQASLVLDPLVGRLRGGPRHVRGVALFRVANCRLRFGDLVPGSCERLLERLTTGCLLIEPSHELCLALRRLLFRSQPISRSALFGFLERCFGVGEPTFEHVAGSGGLGELCFPSRQPLGSRGSVRQVVLSNPFERGRGFVQLLIHCIPSRGGVGQSSLVPRLLFA